MFERQKISPLYTDLYQLTMAQAYFMNQKADTPACFDYFFRKTPYNGGYMVFAGLQELLELIAGLKFEKDDIDFLHHEGFDRNFLDHLESFSFKGNIHSVQEGDLVFPNEPIVRVDGGLLETQLIETLLLNVLNFQSLIATKAARIRQVAKDKTVTDFGLRRAQSYGGIMASRAAIIGGFNSTSNVFAAHKYDIPCAGTMAHSFIECFASEIEAFRAYARVFPDSCILLVDTYNTLKNGIPNAIIVAKELEKKGFKLKGVRLDSGDLAYISKKTREMLDKAGLEYVKIVVSNQLDEYVVKSLLEQGAPIDIFGIGTNLVTGSPDSAVDGVYKLAEAGKQPTLKISENIQKVTLPAKKHILRYYNSDGQFYGDAVALIDEKNPEKMYHPFEKNKSIKLKNCKSELLTKPVMQNGRIVTDQQKISEINDYLEHRLSLLPEEHKRFDFPHIYKVGISKALMNLRDEIILKYQPDRGND